MSLIDLYDFWFTHPHMWFNATPEDDSIITKKFKYLHDNPPSCMDFEMLTHKEKISYIILYDQITRHIYRDIQEIIQDNLNKIIPIAQIFYHYNMNNIMSHEYAFVMLPLRHSKDYNNFHYVVKETWKKINVYTNSEKDKQTYIRFLTVTYERYIRDIYETDMNQIICYKPTYKTNFDMCDFNILDSRCIGYTSDIKQTYTDDLDEHIKHLNKEYTYILSLSGGVDSMVLSTVLKRNNIKFVCVHISYQNRIECDDEIEILKSWCDILDVKLYYRRIHEIKRKECMDIGSRELYESYTRDVRFNMYKLVGKILNYDIPKVFLGHNKDDTFENILTNIASQSHYENLTGMELVQTISNIEFHRPLLNITKKEIYEFSKLNNIIHFPNSTPSWSQRGKIRDLVKPTLINWNPVIIDSFFKLSSELGMYTNFIKQYAKTSSDIIKNTGEMKININNICFLESYWNFIFRDNNIWISTKSNQNFIAKLEYILKNFDRIKINVLEHINLCKDKQIKWKKINNSEIVLDFN
jgi:tRNA(Ile)-lysidine synthetase-like protein